MSSHHSHPSRFFIGHSALLSSKTPHHERSSPPRVPVQSRVPCLAFFDHPKCASTSPDKQPDIQNWACDRKHSACCHTGLRSLHLLVSFRPLSGAHPCLYEHTKCFRIHACPRPISFLSPHDQLFYSLPCLYTWFTPILDLYRSHRAMHGNTPARPSKTDPPPLVPPPPHLTPSS